MKALATLIIILVSVLLLLAQENETTKIDIYGQFMTDFGLNTGQVNPDYFDVMRPTQLPSYENEYGTDGNISFGVRQTRLGFKSFTPSKIGKLQTRFEFDLYGLGPNVGQTTFHLLYAYIELGKFGFGHNWSLFSDIDGFPNTIEYWGPAGMSLCKNVQFRFIPVDGATRLAFALERPGASADEGIYENRIELADVKPYFNVPDFTAEFRQTGNWGYAEISGAIRKIEWIDQGTDQYDLSGKAIGWGLNFSTNLKLSKGDLLRGQAVVGSGIGNLMNDVPADIGIKNNFNNPVSPIKGVPLPVTSYMIYFDHSWNEKLSSSAGFSAVHVKNSDAQAPSEFKNGKYASINVLYYLVKGFTAGAEIIWINRENMSDGWSSSCTRIQLSARYSFAHQLIAR